MVYKKTCKVVKKKTILFSLKKYKSNSLGVVNFPICVLFEEKSIKYLRSYNRFKILNLNLSINYFEFLIQIPNLLVI